MPDSWVRIECTFQCRACGFRVPLNHLAMDGAVLCARCGLEQAFDVERWRKALGHARHVAESPRRGDRLVVGGDNAFAITASAGQPHCSRCHTPAEVQVAPDGSSTLACAPCGKRSAYAPPPEAARRMMPGLRAVLAREYRTDKAPARVKESAGAIAITCPSCNAPLDATAETMFLTCAYCKTKSRVTDRTWWRLRGGEPAIESVWLLYERDSALADVDTVGADPAKRAAPAQGRADVVASGERWETTGQKRGGRGALLWLGILVFTGPAIPLGYCVVNQVPDGSPWLTPSVVSFVIGATVGAILIAAALNHPPS